MNGNDDVRYNQPQYSCEEDGKTWYILNMPSNQETKPETQQDVYPHFEEETKVQGLDPNMNGSADVGQIPPKIVKSDMKKNQKTSKRPRNEDMVVSNSKQMFQNVDALADGRFYCRICERSYKTNTTMIAHLRGRHLRSISQCMEPGCDFVARTNYESRKHQRTHEKQFAKALKQDLKKSKEAIVKDMFRADADGSRSVKELIDLTFPCEEELKTDLLHNSTCVPGMRKSSDMSGRGKGKFVFTCLECSHSFNNPYQARKHHELHLNESKQCYYCDEVQRGDILLREHYMKNHRFEGIRTFTCTGCKREFTSIDLFHSHIKNNPDVNPVCRDLNMRQDIYYGELPPGIIIDDATQKRIDILRYHHLLRESKKRVPKVEMVNPISLSYPKKRRVEPSVFDGFSMIQTEMGLKTVGEVMKSAPRSRPPRMSLSDCGSMDSIEEELLVDSPDQHLYLGPPEQAEMRIAQQHDPFTVYQNHHIPQTAEWNNQNMTEYTYNNMMFHDNVNPGASGSLYDRRRFAANREQSSNHDHQYKPHNGLEINVAPPQVDVQEHKNMCQTPSNFDKDPMMGFDLQCYNIADNSKFYDKNDDGFNCSVPSSSTMFANSSGRDEMFDGFNKLDYGLSTSNNSVDDGKEEYEGGFDQLFKVL